MTSVAEYKKKKRVINRKEMANLEIALGFRDPDGTVVMDDYMADAFGTPEGFRRETEVDRKRIDRIMNRPGSVDLMADYLTHLATAFRNKRSAEATENRSFEP